MDEALALSHNKPGTALRSAVAASYVEFARLLRQIAAGTTGKLVSALTAWSAASAKVGGYLARHEPRPGFVIDYGPTEKDWNAGRAAAEKVCGHPLPNTK